MNHTPGPWIAFDDMIKNKDHENVACVLSDDYKSDARLIAAAPDLLFALDVLQASPNDPAAYRIALDALKNAKGNRIMIRGMSWEKAISPTRGSCDGCGIPLVTTCDRNKNIHPCGLDWVLVRSRIQQNENDRLIAAAPEMHAALLEIAATTTNENSDPDRMADALGEIQGIVRRALKIAKEEGQAKLEEIDDPRSERDKLRDEVRILREALTKAHAALDRAARYFDKLDDQGVVEEVENAAAESTSALEAIKKVPSTPNLAEQVRTLRGTLADNLQAWEGEEESVREEHAELIDETRAALEATKEDE